ncbi:protein toll-like [Battus philenor]|uniref:protein toll-like n=1 Tax=Battus philenor TaxID=42288 RepID=UPI0035CFD094
MAHRLSVLGVLVALGALGAALDAGPECPPPPAACHSEGFALDEYFYRVDGANLNVNYGLTYLTINCHDAVSLDSASMPRFARAVLVQRAELRACAAPTAGYAHALAALNVSVLDHLVLERPSGALGAQQLSGLQVSALSIRAPPAAPLPLARGALVPLAALLDLRLQSVLLTDAELAELPPALRRLSLTGAGVVALPAHTLRRLSALVHLALREPKLTAAPDVGAAPALRDVVVMAPLDALPSSPALENLTVWEARNVTLRGGCASLRLLDVYRSRGPLPVSWLTGCTRLATLSLKAMDLGTLPPGLLHSAPELAALTARSCNLSALPPDLLTQSRRLLSLDLSDNKLETLPEGLFAAVRGLQELRLAGNRLTRAAAAPVFAQRTLHALALADNPLGDLCDDGTDTVYSEHALSELWQMRGLRALELRGTRATRLCADWRLHMRELALLDLQRNNITQLTAAELQWQRDVKSRVLLRGNDVRLAALSPADYRNASAAPLRAHVTEFVMDATLTCDCHVYWAARLVQERADVPIRSARCRDSRPLLALRVDDLQCELPGDDCAPRCACRLLGTRLEVSCPGAGLTRAPRMPPGAPPAAAMLLPNNSIAALAADDLPPALQLLDLSGNRIADLDDDAAAELLRAPRSVRLARNPLACYCSAPLFTTLHAHRDRVLDFAELRCANGELLADMRPAALCRARSLHAALGAAGALMLLSLCVVAGCLLRRSARLGLKRFLSERGLCLRWLLSEEPARDERVFEYDVFVSFSHHDEKLVTERLVPGLEGGAHPYRLCLHYRDWTPGDWIPAQIARSVRDSRCTLLVVSEHWARSLWAQAEFREAHAAALADARTRLVLLLLDEPAALRDLGPDMQAFLAANTYLRWDDPWFWRKLRHALPRGPVTAPGPQPDPFAPEPPTPPTPTGGEVTPFNTAPVA